MRRPSTRAVGAGVLAVILLAGALTQGFAQAVPQNVPPPAGARRQPRPRLGLALGGGGARGFAHLGILIWLDEHRIPVDVVGGTSMGALIGGAFAAGMTPGEIREIVASIDWAAVLAPETPYASKTFRRREDTRDYPSQLRFGLKAGLKLPTGVSPAQPIELLLARLAAPFAGDVDFDALPTPFRCVSADIMNAEAVVFSGGSLATALRATMAMPGLFPPVETNGRRLVDGGLVNNLPADVVRRTGLADRIVAVDVGADLAIARRGDTMFDVLGQALDSIMRSGARRALEEGKPDLVLVPDLKGIPTVEFGRAEELVRKGYATAEAHAEALLRYGASEAEYEEWAAARQSRRPPPQVTPTRLTVERVRPAEAARIVGALVPRHLNRPLSAARLDADLLALTGDGRYDTATYRIDASRGPSELIVSVRPPKSGPPFLSVALDLENTRTSNVGAAIRGRLTAFDLLGAGSEARLELRTGNTLEARGEIVRPLGRSGLFVAPRAFAVRRDRPVFRSDDYVAEYREDQAGAALDVGFSTRRLFEARLGYTAEHLRRDVRIGDPSFPSVRGSQHYASLRAVFDNQSGPTLPERGVAVKAELRRFFDVPGVRQAGSLVAADTDHLWSANGTASVFRPAGRHGKLFARASGGWSFGETALVNGFSLGGPFELGAYFPNELRGSNCAVANLGYFQEIGRFVEGAIGRLHAGAWIEHGAAFERLRSADFRTNVSAGLLLESPIGPVFAGVSLGEHGRYRVFFSLGRFLPH